MKSNPPPTILNSSRRFSLAVLFVAVLAMVLVTLPVGTTTPSAEAATGCTTTLSPGANLRSSIASAKNGSTICLKDGNYGSLSISGGRSGFVTVKSVNTRKASFSQIIFDDASFVRFEQVQVTGNFGNGSDNSHHIEVAGSDLRTVIIDAPNKSQETSGPSSWLIEFNDIHDCPGFCVGLLSGDPTKYRPVSDVTIRGNKMGPMAGGQDAIRVHNWKNVVIADNEIFGVVEDGQHNDCLQSVWGGSGMVFSGNYLHDNNCQTFFLKDGYTSAVTFENNLSLRNRNGSASVVGKIYPTGGFTMRNNTLWDGSGFYLRSIPHKSPFPTGSASNYSVTNNVIDIFIPYDDSKSHAGLFATSNLLTEDYNVFGGGWTWVPNHMGSHSIEDASPNFIRTSTSASQDASVGDWRLKSKVSKGGSTFSAGITWKLAGRNFGIKAFDGGYLSPGGGGGGSGGGGGGGGHIGTFSDDDGNAHQFAIEAIAKAGITLGCNPPANDRFCPDQIVTRDQMAAFMVRAGKLPATNIDFFVDDNGSIFENDINKLAAAGIVSGRNPPANNRYCPTHSMSRGEMAAMLTRALGYAPVKANTFIDDNGHTFEQDIERIAAHGITQGCNPPTNDRFCPNKSLRRSEMATFLARALGLI